MNVENLVTMANQIGSFYETMPDRATALADSANHIKKFWEPRMRRALLAYLDEAKETELSPFVLEAIQSHRSLL
ncbi:formate dehydrogenase subunit delta [Sapientia aquatica]|uniref:Formate dehydrogenase n=1 Tax=Sapientia aquatica TaxID=1549640 RepID=A0A4R5W5V8_9BURK|nr:formate dehydrogenase subunit delta [Sapientia aquatica]TDK68449.1 formate dehydrogenase [Sapientia aquatica]